MHATDFVLRSEPIAFFLTWTTYGSWLPGDRRGWTDGRGRMMLAEPHRALRARRRMVEAPLKLDIRQQAAVMHVIDAHCKIRRWNLHAVNCRTQHVHVVVTAPGTAAVNVLSQFKSWASRRLRMMDIAGGRTRWWTEGGSKRWIYDETELLATVTYVNECQDKPREPR